MLTTPASAPERGEEADAFDSEARAAVDAWIRRRTVPEVLVVAAIVFYVAYFTKRSLDIHHSLGTASYDSALYDQGMWLLSRFEAPFVTLMGRNMLGDHTSFILLFLVPFYWIAPGAWIMFFFQSAAIGAGALPIFLFARSRWGSGWMALVPAGAYLVHPAVGWTNLENFHPDAFLGVFVGFAIYGALERKWRLYAVFVVLSLLVKEDVSLVIVPLGIWVALKRDRRIGLLTIGGSLAFMAVAMLVVMRGLIGVPTRNAWRIPFGGPSGVIDTALTNPTQLVDHLRSDGRPWYVWQMLAPFGFLFLRRPGVAIISALVLFTNILSTFWYQYQIEYHYALVAVPALAMGTVDGIGAIRDRWTTRSGLRVPAKPLAVAVLAFSSLTASYLWAPLPWGRTELYYGDPSNVYATSMRELIELVPADAAFSTHYRVTPHTAYRTEIYQFPNPFRVDLYGTGEETGRLVERADRIEYVMLPTSTDENYLDDWIPISAAFEQIASNAYWVLYERDFSVELPPPPE